MLVTGTWWKLNYWLKFHTRLSTCIHMLWFRNASISLTVGIYKWQKFISFILGWNACCILLLYRKKVKPKLLFEIYSMWLKLVRLYKAKFCTLPLLVSLVYQYIHILQNKTIPIFLITLLFRQFEYISFLNDCLIFLLCKTCYL